MNIDGKELTRVAEYKYLGVILDESLSWTAHVNYLISKVSNRIGILGHTRRSISMHTAGIIYRSYTVFTNGGHAGKNWCLVMKARRWRVNKNCK